MYYLVVFFYVVACSIIVVLCTSRARQAGAEVSKKETTISQRKKLPIDCAEGDQPVRCPNGGFCGPKMPHMYTNDSMKNTCLTKQTLC